MKYQYWLSNIPGVGCKTIHRLLGQAGSAEEIYFLKKEQLEKLSGLSDRQVHAITERKKNWDLEEKYAALGENGISFLSCEMESYPKQLRNIVDAPYSLYIKGKMPDFSKRRVAVVGARMCSEYGKKMAEQIGEKLALCGAEVLSGMARGIDAYGHIGALKAGGNTYAVLGCGVNVCYPRTNQKLYENILSHGGIISEYPPETEPIAQLFPARNRIISALSDVVVIVEAKERSGSLITADFALEQGKDIYAVPGRAEVLAAFDGVELVVDNPAPEGEEDLFGEINTESEIALNNDNTHVQNIVEHALSGDMTMEEIVDEWNQAWTDAQEEYDVTPAPYVYGSGVVAE